MAAKCVLDSRTTRRLSAAVLLLTVVVFLSSAAWAHSEDDDEGDDPGPATRSASLMLRYDARGTAKVNLYTDSDVQDWRPLQMALASSLHCPAAAFAHPESDQDSSKLFETLNPGLNSGFNAKLRARMDEMAARQRMRSLRGTCQATMARDGFMLYTGVNLETVLSELGKVGEQQLHVNVTYQASAYAQPLPFVSRRSGDSRFQSSAYKFDVADPFPPNSTSSLALPKTTRFAPPHCLSPSCFFDSDHALDAVRCRPGRGARSHRCLVQLFS